MNIKSKSQLLIMTAALTAGLSQSAYAELIVNGGFETCDLSGWTFSPTTFCSDFFVASTEFAPVITAHSGNNFAAFGAISGLDDTISQTLPTVNGGTYGISFWLNNADGFNSSYLTVQWGITTLLQITPASDNFCWTQFSFT